MRFKPLPSADLLRSLLKYDPETGSLTWRASPHRHERGNRRWTNQPAVHVSQKGYYQVRVQHNLYQAHRIIWKIMTGEDPEDEIDHEDRDKLNNRWVNLRESSRSQQLHNKVYVRRIDLPRGVHECDGKYFSQIGRHGKIFRTYGFSTIAEAENDYRSKKQNFFGAHAFRG